MKQDLGYTREDYIVAHPILASLRENRNHIRYNVASTIRTTALNGNLDEAWRLLNLAINEYYERKDA